MQRHNERREKRKEKKRNYFSVQTSRNASIKLQMSAHIAHAHTHTSLYSLARSARDLLNRGDGIQYRHICFLFSRGKLSLPACLRSSHTLCLYLCLCLCSLRQARCMYTHTIPSLLSSKPPAALVLPSRSLHQPRSDPTPPAPLLTSPSLPHLDATHGERKRTKSVV